MERRNKKKNAKKGDEEMLTISVIKADVGSLAGHIRPSRELVLEINKFMSKNYKNFIKNFCIATTGDDISIIMTHYLGESNHQVHALAWNAFKAGTEIAKKQGLYGAGQDLLKDAFSGNVKGLGPAVAEMEIEERESEPFIVFAADKTDPGAYNLMFYLAFADPMYNSGLLLSPAIRKGFTFTIMDVAHTKGDRIIRLNTPEDSYDIAALLRDGERFVIEKIHSRYDNAQVAAVSTTRLHNIAGKYTGKDDPVAIVRTQKNFPATGEILHPFSITPLVAGFMRGSHVGPLMPVKIGTGTSYFDGPPLVSALGFNVKNGKLTTAVDLFDHPFWEHIREKAAKKALSIREQGFFGSAMLPISELEYGGIKEILQKLEPRFEIRD